MTITWPVFVGSSGASAARRTPRILFTTSVAPESSAPVLPADTRASPSPFFSRFRPTVMLESLFLR